ncbi:MAG: hypothetical protein ACJ8CR_36565 [Roseiflexaceae bacterium]
MLRARKSLALIKSPLNRLEHLTSGRRRIDSHELYAMLYGGHNAAHDAHLGHAAHAGGHAGHDKHAGHSEAMFRRPFFDDAPILACQVSESMLYQ